MKEAIGALQEERKENEVLIQSMKQEIAALKVKAIDLSQYKSWKSEDILLWILSIDDGNGNKVFAKYQETMSKEIENMDLKGSDLGKLDKNEAKELGIHVFRDRILLIDKIGKLIAQQNNPKQNDEGATAHTAFL